MIFWGAQNKPRKMSKAERIARERAAMTQARAESVCMRVYGLVP